MGIEGEPGSMIPTHTRLGEVWLYRVELAAVEDDVELGLPLSPPEHWDYRNAPLDLVYEVLGIEPELHVGCAVKLPPPPDSFTGYCPSALWELTYVTFSFASWS